MNKEEYKIILSKITNTSEATRHKDIFYKCKLCGNIIPSTPKDNMGCKCGNIFIDVDYVRLAIEDYSNFIVLQKVN